MNRYNFFPKNNLNRLFVAASMLLFFCSFIHAQDTIVKRNDEKIVAKIAEVNTNNVKYKRFDYQDGPVFNSEKWELKYIVYANGVRESFENYVSQATVRNDNAPKKDLTIQPTGKYYYYQNQKIEELDMLDIAWKLNDKKINLLVKQTETKRVAKNFFYISGITLDALGILTYTGVISAYTLNVHNATTGGGYGTRRAAQAAARTQRERTGGYMILSGLACEAISLGFKFDEIKHAHMVVTLYNQAVASR